MESNPRNLLIAPVLRPKSSHLGGNRLTAFQLSSEPYLEPIERIVNAAGERVVVQEIGGEFRFECYAGESCLIRAEQGV